MPIYAYRCPGCGHDFDEQLPIADRDAATCPTCGDAAKRLLATFAAVGATPEPAAACGPSTCAARQAAGMPCSAGGLA